MSEITLSARVDPGWNEPKRDFRAANEDELRYGAFLGDILFTIDDADFSSRWGWIPILDFALGINWVLSRLPTAGYEVFEFTESGAELRFELTDNEVEVRSNYVPAIARVPLDDLRAAAHQLNEQVLTNARDIVVGIDANPVFRRWVEELAAGS